MQRQPSKRTSWRAAGLILAAGILAWGLMGLRDRGVQAKSTAPEASSPNHGEIDGRELFQRNWLADDPRSPDGDGLGPMFNETSCAGCHNQGGPGGAGPASKNVELLTAFVAQPVNFLSPSDVSPEKQREIEAARQKAMLEATKAELKKVHPGFEKDASVVVHRFGTSTKHAAWRSQLLTAQAQLPQPFNVISPGRAPKFTQPGEAAPAAEAPADFEPAPDQQTGSSNVPPSQPTRAVGPAANVPTDPTPFAPGAAQDSPPASQPVQPFVGTFTAPVPQASQTAAQFTGIPLVDEALKEMRRLKQEARSDLSGSINRGRVVLLRSQRNTSALFGSGVIDAIPDSVIEAAAAKKHEDFPRVSGRVHRLPDQKIGKFGWKAQKASLRDFTLAACANELGLDVPEHAQPDVPYDKDQKRKGHDMTEKEADALVAYVRSLPAPIQDVPKEENAAKQIEDGKDLFESVGCAVCHTENMGSAKGVFSDFLLHDMGEQLQASGSYGTILTPQPFDPTADEPVTQSEGKPEEGNGAAAAGDSQQASKKKTAAPATSAEWRTPPLWGVRDSAPYLHDGRASTLEQAIALHGGEGSDAAIRYFMMPAKKRQRMIAFLKTLRAPEQHAAAK